MQIQTATPAALDEKMTKLLLKLRKGADASLSLTQLTKVLGLLGGWTVEETVGLTPIHYTGERDKALRARVCVQGETAARAAYDRFAALVVDARPAAPKLGQVYVMNLGAFALVTPYYKDDCYGAQFEVWIGGPGYRITAPSGEQFEIIADRSDIHGWQLDMTMPPAVDVKTLRRRLRVWNALRWLKADTSYLAQINTLLGMEEHVPAAQRTRENTGTCACCFRNIKLDHDHKDKSDTHPTMALHGYLRPGDGDIRGRCDSSAWFAPYELSSEGTAQERDYAEQRLAGAITRLAEVKNPDMVEITTWTRRGEKAFIYRKGEPDWDRQLELAVKSAERDVETSKDERDVFAYLVENWKLRALPEAGKPEPHYYSDAARAVRAAKEKQS